MRSTAIAAVVTALMIVGCGRIGFDAGAISDAAGDGPVFAECTMRDALTVPTTGRVMGNLVVGPSNALGTCGGDTTNEDIYQLDVTIPGSKLQVASDEGPSDRVLLYIRTACDMMNSELACDVMSGIATSPLITMDASPGRYYVVVDGQSATTGGDYEATMNVLLPAGATCDPTNARDRCGPSLGCMAGTCQPESCDSAFVLGGASPFMVIADTRTQPNLHGGTCGDGSDGGSRAPEMIYRLDLATPVANLVVSTDSVDTDFDTLVYVRDGCNGVELACNDDATPDNNSIASTGPLDAGTYFIFIDGFGPQEGLATTTITLTP